MATLYDYTTSDKRLVLSTKCWVLSAEYWGLSTECWVLSAECWVLSAECWVLSADYWVLSAECLSLQSTAVRGKQAYLQQVVCQEWKPQIDGWSDRVYKSPEWWLLKAEFLVLSYECWVLSAEWWVMSTVCWVLVTTSKICQRLLRIPTTSDMQKI